MAQLTNLEERIAAFMARKHATKAVKFINTQSVNKALHYEVTGEV